MSTIRDVAKLANVSTATVSRILNQDTRYKITPETRARVLAAVEALGYQFQSRSRQPEQPDPARVKIGCILSVTKKKYNDPYFMSILSGAEEQLRSKGYSVSFIRTGNELSDRNLLTSTFEDNISALILMETLNEDIYDYIRSKVPHIVGIDTRRDDIDNVAYDHLRVAIQATEYLISLGHSRIGYIGGSGESGNIRQSLRYQGYFLAMQSAGLPIEPRWVIDCEWDEELCGEKLRQMCRKNDLPTAFFVGSDLMALAAMNAMTRCGISIPGDVAVVGMSDIDAARYASPALTTLRVPMEQIGIIAANLLIERINGSTLLPQKVTLPSQLIKRESA